MCVSLTWRAIKNLETHVSPQWRAQKCTKQVRNVRGISQHTRIIVSPQFWRFDDHEMTKGLPVDGKNLRFTSVLDVRRLRSDERVRGHTDKFAFHHSFDHPTITFCVKGCSGDLKNLHFTTGLSVRRSLFALRVARAI